MFFLKAFGVRAVGQLSFVKWLNNFSMTSLHDNRTSLFLYCDVYSCAFVHFVIGLKFVCILKCVHLINVFEHFVMNNRTRSFLY